jgi:hypothetical protein
VPAWGMGSCRLLVDLPLLAFLAVPTHGCHVLAHTLPHKHAVTNAFGGMYARVCHAVNGVENGWSVRQWHQ